LVLGFPVSNFTIDPAGKTLVGLHRSVSE
jgi:hypothetical protein